MTNAHHVTVVGRSVHHLVLKASFGHSNVFLKIVWNVKKNKKEKHICLQIVPRSHFFLLMLGWNVHFFDFQMTLIYKYI